ncbi:MAG: DUF1858 domain-containing protein [Candidatus Coatesbacteria bacterium]|nr:DUF1858 domain-containing protein [Candidatus Coatesbacteria bacterium]
MITKDMPITRIIQQYPETRAVFAGYNLGCLGCLAASGESLEQGLAVHGLNVEKVLKDLNEAIKK